MTTETSRRRVRNAIHRCYGSLIQQYAGCDHVRGSPPRPTPVCRSHRGSFDQIKRLWTILIIVTVLSSGCVTSVPLPGPGDGTSVFVHPVTGEVKHCDNPGATAMFRGGILAANAYADCKTAAEEQGFVRKRDKGSN